MFETIWQAIQILIEMALDAISAKVQEIWNGIVAFLTPILEGISSFFQSIWAAITNTVSNALNAIRTAVTNVWNTIKGVITSVIGIPHAYLNRKVGIHVAYVTAQVLSGELTVETRGVFFTISAGNFAEPVDDISMDVRDITIRQLTESSGPDQIWIVGIEKGKMLVSRRDYRESYSSNPVLHSVSYPL